MGNLDFLFLGLIFLRHLGTNSDSCRHWEGPTSHICELLSAHRPQILSTSAPEKDLSGRGPGMCWGPSTAHPEVGGSWGVDLDLAFPVGALTPAGHADHQVLQGPGLAQC